MSHSSGLRPPAFGPDTHRGFLRRTWLLPGRPFTCTKVRGPPTGQNHSVRSRQTACNGVALKGTEELRRRPETREGAPPLWVGGAGGPQCREQGAHRGDLVEAGVSLCGRIGTEGLRPQPEMRRPRPLPPPGCRLAGKVSPRHQAEPLWGRVGVIPAPELSVRVPLSVLASHLCLEPRPASFRSWSWMLIPSVSQHACPEHTCPEHTCPACRFPSQSLPLGDLGTLVEVSRRPSLSPLLRCPGVTVTV